MLNLNLETYSFEGLVPIEGTIPNYLYESIEIGGVYESYFNKSKGSITTNYDNSSEGKFQLALATLEPTSEQIDRLNLLFSAFIYIESAMDPYRLNYTISKATDDEITITRISENGISKIIIDVEGLLAHSYVSYSTVGNDFISFFEEEVDNEILVYKFLAI